MYAVYPTDIDSRNAARRKCRAQAAAAAAAVAVAASSFEPSLHRCRHCQRSFTKQYNLLIHERTHKEEGNGGINLSFCDVCGKVFRKAENMKNHRAMHSPPSVPTELKGFLTECISY